MGHNSSVQKFIKIKTILNILSDHLKVEINYKAPKFSIKEIMQSQCSHWASPIDSFFSETNYKSSSEKSRVQQRYG